MTISIELSDEVAQSLKADADAHGVQLTEYVQQVLHDQVSPAIAASTVADRLRAWRELGTDLPHTPPLSDEAISRESMYGDRG